MINICENNLIALKKYWEPFSLGRLFTGSLFTGSNRGSLFTGSLLTGRLFTGSLFTVEPIF